jgi:hypothetical protein
MDLLDLLPYELVGSGLDDHPADVFGGRSGPLHGLKTVREVRLALPIPAQAFRIFGKSADSGDEL